MKYLRPVLIYATIPFVSMYNTSQLKIRELIITAKNATMMAMESSLATRMPQVELIFLAVYFVRHLTIRHNCVYIRGTSYEGASDTDSGTVLWS